MERSQTMRALVTLIVLILIVLTGQITSIFLGMIAGVLCFLFLSGMFVWNGIIEVPANPPHKAILVFLGKRQDVVLDEGYNWLPFSGIIFDFILIKVEKINHNFEPQEVRTPDNALLDVKVAATWIPGIDNEPESYITYLNSGGPDRVKEILHNIVEDRTKTWARSNKEGPATWEEAQATKDDAHEVLVKAIMRQNLGPIDSQVPTSTWMRFFDRPQSAPTVFDADVKNGWAWKNPDKKGDWNWDGLQAYFNGLPEAERNRIRSAVEDRRRTVRELREGNGHFPNRSLGITILMFVVNDIRAKGAAAEFADKAEEERLQREAETVEAEHVAKIAKTIQAAHPDLSSEKALETVQVERAKVRKQIVQISGAQTALGNDLAAAVTLRPGGVLPPASANSASQPNNPSKGGEAGSQGGYQASGTTPAQKKNKTKKQREMTDDEANDYLDELLNGEDDDEEDD